MLVDIGGCLLMLAGIVRNQKWIVHIFFHLYWKQEAELLEDGNDDLKVACKPRQQQTCLVRGCLGLMFPLIF